jgi:hypothetical protein
MNTANTDNRCDLTKMCECYLTMSAYERITVCRQNPSSCTCRDYALAGVPVIRKQYKRPITRALEIVTG